MIYTIGHSTHPIAKFIEMLAGRSIQRLVDIRTIPKSKYNPQYNQEQLAESLQKRNIAYTWQKGLGGLRRPKQDSINNGWKNSSFRGYADYMQSPEFGKDLHVLIADARKKSTVIMCAEAVPWRCHRSLVADALLAYHVEVRHILGPKNSQPHKLTAFAKVDGLSVTYPKISDEPTLFTNFS